MARFSKETAAEMGRRGGRARRAPVTRGPNSQAFRAFAEELLSDEKVRARILTDARAGRLPAGTISALIGLVAGRPGAASPVPPPEEAAREEALARAEAVYDSLTPEERKVALKMARLRLGRPEPDRTTAEDNRRIAAAQDAASRAD